MAEPTSLTVNDAAAVLCVHPNTVRNMIAAGEMDASKPFGVWRIKPAALRKAYASRGGDPSELDFGQLAADPDADDTGRGA